MSDSEAKKAWARDNMMLVGLKLHRKYDADLVEYLTSLADKKQATIKAALREYMAAHNEAPQSEENTTTDETT